MSNPFERHKIRHLSPSALNLWANEPALYVLKYLHGIRDEMGAAAKRGTAVEAGLDVFLMNRQASVEDCTQVAIDNYRLNTGGLADDEHEKEAGLIAPMLTQAIGAMRSAPSMIARQLSIETWIDGIPVPVIGFLDYVFEDGSIVDLKTTARLPSAPRPDHLRQVSIYAHARQAPVSLLYVTPQKHARYHASADQVAEGLADITRVARSLARTLAASETAADVAEFVSPKFDSFYWTEETITHARSIWK
jgi:hypothetical protein